MWMCPTENLKKEENITKVKWPVLEGDYSAHYCGKKILLHFGLHYTWVVNIWENWLPKETIQEYQIIPYSTKEWLIKRQERVSWVLFPCEAGGPSDVLNRLQWSWESRLVSLFFARSVTSRVHLVGHWGAEFLYWPLINLSSPFNINSLPAKIISLTSGYKML